MCFESLKCFRVKKIIELLEFFDIVEPDPKSVERLSQSVTDWVFQDLFWTTKYNSNTSVVRGKCAQPVLARNSFLWSVAASYSTIPFVYIKRTRRWECLQSWKLQHPNLHFPPVIKFTEIQQRTLLRWHMYLVGLRCSKQSNNDFKYPRKLSSIGVYIGEKYCFEKCLNALVTEIIFTEMYLLGEGSPGHNNTNLIVGRIKTLRCLPAAFWNRQRVRSILAKIDAFY